ncbi:MAG: hypothetical protein JXA89_10235, partial [Anaerolineae bacterium]|nr:hypothetical protein [Anaerolineae bacterium]
MRSRFMQWMAGPQYALGRFLALAVLGTLCMIVAVFWGWRNETWTERAVLPLSDPLANRNELGVNVDLQQYEPADLAVVLADIESAGFRWVRQRFPWSEIEPEPRRFEWATWDVIVATCAEHDLELIAVLDGAPLWARSDVGANLPLTPPQQVADWGAFVDAFARRYRG